MSNCAGNTCEDMKVGCEMGVSFNLDPIKDSPYGNANNLCGIIPLVLPCGEYTQPTIFDTQSKEEDFDTFIRQKSIEYADCFPNDRDEIIHEKIRTILIYAAQIYPRSSQNITHPIMDPYVSFVIMVFVLDDILDDMADECLTYSIAEKMDTLASGVVLKSADDINLPAPLDVAFAPFKNMLWKCIKIHKDGDPDLSAKSMEFIRELLNAFRSHILLTNTKGLSDSSRAHFGYINNGITFWIEYIAMHQNIQLPEKVRKDVLFQRLKLAVGMAAYAMNNIFGIGRDIRNNQVMDNEILRNVVNNKIPLQTSFDNALTGGIEAVNDVKIIINLMKENYRDDQNVKKYIRCVEENLDGQLYYYSRVKRYGEINVKFVNLS